MTWTYTEEYYKQYTRDTWNESAAEYGPLLANLDKYNPDLLAAAAPRAGDRVLDVATGPGEPAMSVASRVAPQGSVLGVDLSERMVELARSNAKARGLANADFKVMDAEALELPDAAFDLALCRFGLQIVTDPAKAAAEIHRVLKPGGRFGATVWGAGKDCPGIDVIIAPMLEFAEPDETGYIPTPYEMSGPGELVAFLEEAGFRDATEKRVVHDWTFPSAEAWLASALKGTPIGHSLAEEAPEVQRVVLEKTRANMKRWLLPDGSVRAPCQAVVVSARK